jgi:hypothetical protein
MANEANPNHRMPVAMLGLVLLVLAAAGFLAWQRGCTPKSRGVLNLAPNPEPGYKDTTSSMPPVFDTTTNLTPEVTITALPVEPEPEPEPEVSPPPAARVDLLTAIKGFQGARRDLLDQIQGLWDRTENVYSLRDSANLLPEPQRFWNDQVRDLDSEWEDLLSDYNRLVNIHLQEIFFAKEADYQQLHYTVAHIAQASPRRQEFRRSVAAYRNFNSKYRGIVREAERLHPLVGRCRDLRLVLQATAQRRPFRPEAFNRELTQYVEATQTLMQRMDRIVFLQMAELTEHK